MRRAASAGSTTPSARSGANSPARRSACGRPGAPTRTGEGGMLLGHYTSYELATLRQQALRGGEREEVRDIDAELARRAAKRARQSKDERLRVALFGEAAR